MSDEFHMFIEFTLTSQEESDAEWSLRVLQFVLTAQADKRYNVVKSFKVWYKSYTCLSEIYKMYESVNLVRLSHTIPGEATYQRN